MWAMPPRRISTCNKNRTSNLDVLFQPGAGYEARTRFPASHELPAAIRRNPASPLIGCALRARVEAASSLRLTKKQDTQIGCPVLTVQQRRKTAEVLRNGRKRVCGKPISGFPHHFNPKRNTTLLGGVSFWSGLRGSNSLPPPWQGGALPDELSPRNKWYSIRRETPCQENSFIFCAAL